MVYLHAITDFIEDIRLIPNRKPSYYYEGKCPQTGRLLQLPRNSLAEAIAKSLMEQISQQEEFNREGKMYGVLIVELENGEQKVIKAFSGLLNGRSYIPGWVPPISGKEEIILDETPTLQKLAAIKQEIIALKNIPQRQEYLSQQKEWQQRWEEINSLQKQRQKQRQERRVISQQSLNSTDLQAVLLELENQSRQDGIERKLLKRERDKQLLPLQQIITKADEKILALKRQRKQISQQLQQQMHATYSLINFWGQSQTLQKLMPSGLPTGTGDCCAPKLLNYAAKNQLKPVAIAEFWWGKATADKIPGNFYGACTERCQPIMGFLLSGLDAVGNVPDNLDIIYEDGDLIAVNKPSGLLSVPGRYLHSQDSVLSRLRNLYNDGENFLAIHRLDLETSGILLIARNQDIYRHMSQQFQNRLVKKVYEAVLDGVIDTKTEIENPLQLPLWGNPENRPYQEVNLSLGKPSISHFQIIGTQDKYTRIEFFPLTGRTHQLRVHAAHSQGLGIPILGDKLYGNGYTATVKRLHLHAREIEFFHFQRSQNTSQKIFFKTKTPF